MPRSEEKSRTKIYRWEVAVDGSSTQIASTNLMKLKRTRRSRTLSLSLILLLLFFGSGLGVSLAADSDQLQALQEDIEMVRELTVMLMEIQELLLEQLAIMQQEVQTLQANQTSSVAPQTPVASQRAVQVNSLEVVSGSLGMVGRSAWQTDAATPTMAFYPTRFVAPLRIEATVTFLAGNLEVQLGLYRPNEDAVTMGGTGHSRLAYFTGSGTPRDPGLTWMRRSNFDDSIFEYNRPYSLQVEINPEGSETRVDVYMDGQLVESYAGSSIEDGYPAVRTWQSEVRIENFQVTPL